MIPKDYFSRTDTPSENSPIGRIMRDLNCLYPGLYPHQLREQANLRIHNGGPGKVKWTKEEAKTLREWADSPPSGAGDRT